MFYRRPTRLTQLFNRVVSWLADRGLTPSRTVTLEVPGRRSGEPRTAVINSVEHEGRRYFVSPRGESEWVRNVRAAGGEAVMVHGGRKAVRLEELPAEQRAPILKKYLRENALATGQHFGIGAGEPVERFEEIAARHPVFRIVEGG